jgi:hypothetical protein
MFEKMIERAGRLARRRAEARRGELGKRLEAALPKGIAVEETDEGLVLRGRALSHRFALEARLRWLVAGLVE